MTPSALGRLLNPLRRRVLLMVGRAMVRLINDATRLQELQVSLLAGETHDGVERFQEYGFSSHPHPGAEAVMVCVGGNRGHGLIIAVDDRRHRPTDLAQGEVVIYDDQGSKIHLKRGGIIELTTAAKVVVNAPLVEVPDGDVIAGNISLKNHVHGGVTSGGSNTGPSKPPAP